MIPFMAVARPVDVRRGNRVEFPLLSVSQYHGVRDRSEITDEPPRAEDLSSYKICRAGQIVVNRMSAYQGALGMAPVDGVVSPDYLVLQLSPGRSAEFWSYYMRGRDFVSEMASRVRGIGTMGGGNVRTPRINYSGLKTILVPNFDEQHERSVVSFLDRKTGKIDTFIERQHQLIHGLKVRRQAFLSSRFGTTRMAPLRRDLTFLTSGSRGWAEYYADEGTPFVRIANLSRGDIKLRLDDVQSVNLPASAEGTRTKLVPGDLLFSITAYLGSVAVVPQEMSGAYVSQHVGLVRLRGKLWMPEYVAYFALSDQGQEQLQSSAYGGTKVQIALDDLRSFQVPVVSVEDQKRIVDEVRAELARIDVLIAKSKRLIELSQERRAALITAAVTGQLSIDVDRTAELVGAGVS